jgi:hypothetical protein
VHEIVELVDEYENVHRRILLLRAQRNAIPGD